MKPIFTLRLFLILLLGLGNASFAHGLKDNPCPTAVISYDGSPYCNNAGRATVTITGTRGGIYSSTAGLSVDPEYGFIDLETSVPGTYTVTYTIPGNGVCGDFSTTASITITPAPSASFIYPGSPYCAGSGIASVNFTGTSGGTYSSGPGLMIDPASGDIDLTLSTPGTYHVAYTVAASGGCDAYVVSSSVTINTTPFATISYDNPGYCTNTGIVSVHINGDPGGSFSSTDGLSIDPITGQINTQASIGGTYTVNYALNNNCGSYTTSTIVNIEEAPDASISYDNSPYCTGGVTASVTFNGTPGGTYSADPGLVIDPVSGDIDLGASAAGTYTVSYFVTKGNCSTTATGTVTISAPPNATISYPSAQFCTTGGTASMNLAGTTGGMFSAGAGLAINSVTGDIDLLNSAAGNYTVTYYIPSAGNCGDFTTTTDITIIAGTWANISYPNSPYCITHDTAMIAFTGRPGGTFTSDPGLVIDPVTGTVDIPSSVPGTYVVKYNLDASPCGMVSNVAYITLDSSVCFHGIVLSFAFNDIQASRQFNTVQVNWQVSNDSRITSYDIERSADGIHFIKIGNQLAGNMSSYSWTDLNLATGTNYYRIRSNPSNGASVLSPVTKVGGGTAGIVNIYPNPVTGRIINIQFAGMSEGSYGFKLINADGVNVLYNLIVFKGGNAMHSIKLDKTILPGYYHLEIIHPDGTITIERVVIAE